MLVSAFRATIVKPMTRYRKIQYRIPHGASHMSEVRGRGGVRDGPPVLREMRME